MGAGGEVTTEDAEDTETMQKYTVARSRKEGAGWSLIGIFFLCVFCALRGFCGNFAVPPGGVRFFSGVD